MLELWLGAKTNLRRSEPSRCVCSRMERLHERHARAFC